MEISQIFEWQSSKDRCEAALLRELRQVESHFSSGAMIVEYLFNLALGVGALATLYVLVYVLVLHTYWDRKKLYSPRTMPIIGHLHEFVRGIKSLPVVSSELYWSLKTQGKQMAGIYMFSRAAVFLSHPDMVRKVMSTNAHSFINRSPLFQFTSDPIGSRTLMGLHDQEWREMRVNLTPAFTGAKLRLMSGLMAKASERFLQLLRRRPDDEVEYEMYETFKRIAFDVIATASFGAPSDAINHPESKLYQLGSVALDFHTPFRRAVLIGYQLAPWLMRLLGFAWVPKKVSDYLFGRTYRVIEERERENKSEHDLLQLLLDHKKKDPKKFKNMFDIATQTVTFFIGGYHNVAITLSFASYRMAMHPELQERIREEVLEVKERHNGKLTYDAVKELTYLDMFVHETTRMHPSIQVLDREVSENIELPEEGVTIERGTTVLIPAYAIQHDPDYFPDPETFDPERWSEDNKDNVHPFTHLTFGDGPRACIGKRFAMLEVKLVLANIVSEYRFELCKRTNVSTPTQYRKYSWVLDLDGGIWLNIKKLDQQ